MTDSHGSSDVSKRGRPGSRNNNSKQLRTYRRTNKQQEDVHATTSLNSQHAKYRGGNVRVCDFYLFPTTPQMLLFYILLHTLQHVALFVSTRKRSVIISEAKC